MQESGDKMQIQGCDLQKEKHLGMPGAVNGFQAVLLMLSHSFC